MKKKTKQFNQNTLYKYANDYRKNMTDEDKLEKIDMTQIFLGELALMIKRGEIIIININAKMRLGKSTLGMALGKHIFELLKLNGQRERHEKFGLGNLARDQQEHSKMMRDPKTQATVVVTDEVNALEETGENSSAEKALEQVFSDVQAGRYVHRVCCSPKEVTDPNADILLSITSTDEDTLTTHAKLYYRYYEGGEEYTQLLGFIRLSVADIIKVWIGEAKDMFYKLKKLDSEESLSERQEKERTLLRMKLINIAKDDWYTFYYIKKHEKMELITKEGIMKPRTLDYAEVIMTIINRLRKMSKLGSVVNNKVVKNFCKAQLDKEKIPYSIVGLQLITDEAMGVLDVWKAYWKVTKDILRLDENMHKVRNSNNSYLMERYKENQDEMVEMRDELMHGALEQEEKFKRYTELNSKYNCSAPEDII